MRIIPAYPYANNSNAEIQFFNLLKNIELDGSYAVAFHSVNITNHNSKRFAEADFVIVCKHGLFVFEVKGGSVTVENGQWYTENIKGKYAIQNPFRQANTAVHAINNKINEELKYFKPRIPIGYGVIFPNAKWSISSMEWAREEICDQVDLANFKWWIRSFFDYWNNKQDNGNYLLKSDIDAIVDFLRPNFELVEPLFSNVEFVDTQVLRLTQEQYSLLDIACVNQRIICKGGAGTGKTFLALELAKRLSTVNKNILFVCKSVWLRNFLTSKISSENVDLATMDSINVCMKKSSIEFYDILIIDEGQDVLNFKDLCKLNSILAGGFECGQWYFFHDSNNQSNILSVMIPEALEWLKKQGNPMILPLSINCRNTKKIVETIEAKLNCDLGVPMVYSGQRVVEFTDNTKTLVIKLIELIKTLTDSELDLGQITILSPLPIRKSMVSLLSEYVLEQITVLDDYSVRKIPFDNLTYSQIKDFKGLENDVIILVDMAEPILTTYTNNTLYYVAMTRARAILYCLWMENSE